MPPIAWHQPDLLDGRPSDSDVIALRSHLHRYGWQTRRQICAVLNWPDRKVREVAEVMGAEVVRCQSGFKLTADLAPPDLERANQAAAAAHSQAQKMEAYSAALLARLALKSVSNQRETAPPAAEQCQTSHIPASST